jgi:N-acetylglucosamine-6-phosphate deacetylase
VRGVLIAAPRVLTVDGLVSDAAVVVSEDGRVVEVRRGVVEGDVVLREGVLAPGFVDLQVNGYFGLDFAGADVDRWLAVARRLPETGCTSFLPTIITAPVESLVPDLRRARGVVDDGGGGARVLGVHVEGPFLAEAQAGAHDAAVFCDPTPERIDALLEPGTMALLTLAPERAGALEAISRVAGAGVVVSVGHSDATADVVAAAAGVGLRMVTHLFNAQSGLDHREPGVAAQGLADPRLVCGLILDGHHVAGPVAQIAFAAARGRIALVTDAIAAAGMPPGIYELGGAPVFVRAGEPPQRSDGTLAGAVLRLDEAVGRAISLGVDVPAALEAASRVPADVLGRADLGRIAPGCCADLVWLGPDWRARAAWVGGSLVFGEPA